jgi:peptide deformylase
MKIIIAPDPALRMVCKPVKPGDTSIPRLAKQMAKAMYKNGGCGLAAPQVGVDKRLVVIDCDTDSDEQNPLVLVNPVVVDHGDEQVAGDEGCLSIPGVTLQVPRWTSVVVKAYDLDGEEVTYAAERDLLCRCLQHETDHLDGVTMFERLDPVSRVDALQRYQRALEMGAKPGDMEVHA